MATNLITDPFVIDDVDFGTSIVFEISSRRLRIRVDKDNTGQTYNIELSELSDEQLKDLADLGRRIVDGALAQLGKPSLARKIDSVLP